jgi:tetratricopeptide (TPR) repeat protein
MGVGDGRFQEQEFADAYRNYRRAAQAAPTLAEPHFRQALALTAMGSYELAVKALRRGLAIEPAWAGSGFRSDEVYGAANRVAKNGHIDALAQANLDQPNRADLLFLLGVELYFDGQFERAVPFLERARQVGPEWTPFAAHFLKRAGPAEK